MNDFLKNIFYLVLVLFFLTYSLDYLFTTIQQNNAPRNMPDYTMSLSEKDTLDYAVFGSSRALHYVDIDLIEDKTKKKGFNFGVQGSNIFEIKLNVEQVVKKNITKNVFIQIDFIWNSILPSGRCTVEWFPYINNEDIWKEFKEVDIYNEYILYKRIPFYRYCSFDAKLGTRKIFLSLLGKKMTRIKTKGFVPLDGEIKKEELGKEITYKLNEEFNKHVNDIIILCESKGVDVYFFTSPVYNFKGDLTILKSKLKNYKDFSQSLKSPFLFKDNEHVNAKGAKIFTNMFIEEYFQ